MNRRAAFVVLVSLELLACKRLEVTLGKKSSGSDSKPSASQDVQGFKLTTWNSMEDNLAYLDELKAEGAEALFKIYQEDGRDRLRTGFRRFRDAIVREALHNDGNHALFPRLEKEACATLEQQDLLALDSYGDLREVLGMSFLSRLQVGDAQLFHERLPGQLDEVTKLAFFEFGIGLDGISSYQIKNDMIISRSDVLWKVIHEQSEPESLKAGDDVGVRFSFARSQGHDGRQGFELSALAGPEVYERKASSALPAMALSYASQKKKDGSYQSLTLKKGIRKPDGSWQSTSVSRRITLVQRLVKGDILELTEFNGYGLPHETKQTYLIKLGAKEICVAESWDDEVGNPENPNPPKPHPDDKPGQNGDDKPHQNDY